ncbi:MAG TPA: YdcF family protein [Verrucomicrobiae bacterium]|jgi:uncharacterized SAM-binding protein YcdF (DUF218 family)
MGYFFAPLATPLGAAWLVMALGVVYLSWRRKWRCAGWLAVPLLLLFLAGSTSLTEALVAADERHYVFFAGSVEGENKHFVDPVNPAIVSSRWPPDLASNAVIADAVVALGGGVRLSHYDTLGFAIETGGSRLLTAAELVRRGKARTLVLGGSWLISNKERVPVMSLVGNWLTSWHVVSCEVTNIGVCVNTHEEAVAFKKLEQDRNWKKVFLVTSALHMRRAEATFRKQGVQVVPVAADFEVYGAPPPPAFSVFPREYRLVLLSLYLHERIGWWIYRLRGWV